eukprot:COSAG02_NODE_64136_length_261_cov_0.759259_1_plen_25_part_01
MDGWVGGWKLRVRVVGAGDLRSLLL